MTLLETILHDAGVFEEDPVLNTAREHIQNGRLQEAIDALGPIRDDPTFEYEGAVFDRMKGSEAHFLTGVAEYKIDLAGTNPQEALVKIGELKAFNHGDVVLDFPEVRKQRLKELLTIEEATIWFDQSIFDGARDVLADVSDMAAAGEKVYMLAEMASQEGNFGDAVNLYVRAHEINPERPGGKDKIVSTYETLANPAITPNPTSIYTSLPENIRETYKAAEKKFRRRSLTDARTMFEDIITQLNATHTVGAGFRNRGHDEPIVPDNEAKRAMEARAEFYLAKIDRVESRDFDAARERLNRSVSRMPTQEAYRAMAQVYQAMK